MKVFVNNEARDFEFSTLTVAQLIDQLSLADRKGVAVAVNQDVVPKDDWKNQQLQNNDKVLLINATQGG